MIKKVNEVPVIPEQGIVCSRGPDQTFVRSWKHIRRRITHFLSGRGNQRNWPSPTPRPKTKKLCFLIIPSSSSLLQRQIMKLSICALLCWISSFWSYNKESHKNLQKEAGFGSPCLFLLCCPKNIIQVHFIVVVLIMSASICTKEARWEEIVSFENNYINMILEDETVKCAAKKSYKTARGTTKSCK